MCASNASERSTGGAPDALIGRHAEWACSERFSELTIERTAHVAHRRGAPDVAASLLEHAQRLTPIASEVLSASRGVALARALGDWRRGAQPRGGGCIDRRTGSGRERSMALMLRAIQVLWTEGADAGRPDRPNAFCPRRGSAGGRRRGRAPGQSRRCRTSRRGGTSLGRPTRPRSSTRSRTGAPGFDRFVRWPTA